MFQSNVRCISWDSDENLCLQSRVDELVSCSSMKEKFWIFCEKMLWVEKTSESGWEVWVFILTKVSHSKNLDGMEKLEKSKLNPLSSQKTQVRPCA